VTAARLALGTTLRRLPALPRVPRRTVGAIAAAALLLAAGWLWLRDSSLVAVRHVSVSGLTTVDAPRIRLALESAARDMTTLHLRPAELRFAVRRFPIVADVRVSASFPHRVRVTVIEHHPIAALAVADRRIAIARDGTVLATLPAPSTLATIPLRSAPSGVRLTDRRARAALAIVAAAPRALRVRIARVTTQGGRGLAVALDAGPTLYFGTSGQLAAKWAAAARVLADSRVAGATYVDVRLPARPAVGGLPNAPSASAAAADAGQVVVSAQAPAVDGASTSSGTAAGATAQSVPAATPAAPASAPAPTGSPAAAVPQTTGSRPVTGAATAPAANAQP